MQKVIIVGIQTQDLVDSRFEMQMTELNELVQTAGGEVTRVFTQKRERVDQRHIVGKGKLAELREAVLSDAVDMVIFYDQLSPSQNRNIQAEIDVPVIDRVQLILDIFAQHATSVEGKLQVALAQNEYLLPRLIGFGQLMSRLGGGIGTRGPGETKLEQNRRVLRQEIQRIKQDLKEVSAHRERTRQRRQSQPLFKVGLIGYTNAGKSTILNEISQAETLEADQLFATLTPLTRTFYYDNQFQVTMTDTVGFIQDLPPMIIDAFHSTLEENRGVDLLLIVIDASSPYATEQEEVVMAQLKALDMDSIPYLFVYNKMDLVPDQPKILYNQPAVTISAKSEEGIATLRQAIVEEMKKSYDRLELYISPDEINQWLKHSQSIFIEILDFIEAKNQYQLICYKPKDLPIKW